MTQINAYLNFSGNCREAMTFYQESLGGDLALHEVGDSAMASELPPEAAKNILHSMLTNKGLVLMASDMIGMQKVQGNNVALSINCSSEEEGYTFFTRLSAGGEVDHPFAPMFWGALFGAFTDKFGIRWMVNYDKQANQ